MFEDNEKLQGLIDACTHSPVGYRKPPMTRADLAQLHEDICSAARETQTKKNADYATKSDIFRNFRMFGGLGILVRMSDKLARLRTYEERGTFTVSDEGLRDTIEDLINYAVIYYAYKKDGR